MSHTNHAIAGLLEEMANLLEILDGEGDRPGRVRRQAHLLRAAGVDAAGLGGDHGRLRQALGVEDRTARWIAQYLREQRIDEYQALSEQMPEGLLGLAGVSALDPRQVRMLWRDAGITDLDSLREHLRGELLEELPDFGASKVRELRQIMAVPDADMVRSRLGIAMPVAIWFADRLGHLGPVKKASVAGAVRRGEETVTGITLVAAAEPGDTAGVLDDFEHLKPVRDVMERNEHRSIVHSDEGLRVALRVTPPGDYGPLLHGMTGTLRHRRRIEEHAAAMSMHFRGHRLFGDGGVIDCPSEEELFDLLGLECIAPELRHGRDEVEQAARGSLPRLITQDQVRAELHTHSDASDGRWTVTQIIERAIRRGLHTVAITDHSRSQPQARGLTIQRLEQHVESVRRLAGDYGDRIRVLAGSEVDILEDGRLDYPDSVLKELDLVVASPHGRGEQTPEAATRRLLVAMENPYVTIVGHPTNRVILERAGLAPDMAQVARAAAGRGVALEINCNYHRLDLRSEHARLALDAGAWLAIDTDAHGPGDMDQLVYGVMTARRAGAEAGDVINCLDAPGLAAWIARSRA